MDRIRRADSHVTRLIACGAALLTLALCAPACSLNKSIESTNIQSILELQSELPIVPLPVDSELDSPDRDTPGGIVPSYEMLMQATAKSLEKLNAEAYEGLNQMQPDQSDIHGISWRPIDEGDPYPYEKGEYSFGPPDVVPPFGCNADPANSSEAGNAIEDVLAEVNTSYFPRSFVNRNPLTPTYFNGRNYADSWESSVYQIYGNLAPPENPTDLEYHNYYAGSADIGPGGTCFSFPDYPLTGIAWRVYNRDYDCTPGLNPANLYDFMVAPTGLMSQDYISSGLTSGSFQQFVFGTIEPCYGSAIIFEADSTDSSCDDFKNFMDSPESFRNFFSNPVFGLHLLRWQDMTRPDQDGPWESWFGWPVFGPWAYAGGSPLMTNKGPCYVWGMWYERGVVFWLDFDNDGPLAPYPEVTDEAVAYRFTGENVYCTDGGDYVPLQKMYYGDGGPLLTNVVPLAWRVHGSSSWREMDFRRSFYNIAISQNGPITVDVLLFSRGYGGDPDEDYRYRHYAWDFSNGNTQPAGQPYDPDQQYATAEYLLSDGESESEFRIRVDITDELTTGHNFSFPIRISRIP